MGYGIFFVWICYRFVIFLFFLSVFFSRLLSYYVQSGGLNSTLLAKLDKSGIKVYTSDSFSVGNKSYKLFLSRNQTAKRFQEV